MTREVKAVLEVEVEKVERVKNAGFSERHKALEMALSILDAFTFAKCVNGNEAKIIREYLYCIGLEAISRELYKEEAEAKKNKCMEVLA